MGKTTKFHVGLKLRKLDGFLIGLVSILLIFVMILFHFFSHSVQKSETDLINVVLEKMSENEKSQFETYVDDKVQVLKALAGYPEVYKMVDSQQREFLRGHARQYGFEYFFVMGADGTGFYLDEGEGVYRDQKGEQFFTDIMSNEVYLTEPFYTDRGPAITTVCVSIYNGQNEKVGVLCGALNLESIQNIIKENEMVLEGRCFILNKQGNVISSNMHFDLNSGKTIYSLEESELSLIKRVFTEKKDLGGSIAMLGKDYRAHVTYLSDFRWVMVQCIPVEEITARFVYIEVLQWIMGVLSAGLLVCIYRIIFSWKKSDKKIYTDTLTGCNSRAAVLSLFESLEGQRNIRISLIYMDMNSFKHVNDTYGHDEGDRLLRIFGGALSSIFGTYGFVGRMGGDEFVAILADKSDGEIEELKKTLDSLLWEKSKELKYPYILSCAYGYASREAGEQGTMEELLQQADKKMYQHKASCKYEESAKKYQ